MKCSQAWKQYVKWLKWGKKGQEKLSIHLEEKGIVKKMRRGLSKTNIYIIADYPAMWTCDSMEDLATVIDNKGIKPLTPAEHIAELERMGYQVEIKEKEPETLPARQSNNDSSTQLDTSKQFDNTSNSIKSQDLERYSIDQIKQLFDYDIMIHDNPYSQQDIDSVMDILYNNLNTNKDSIRIAGQDKPSMVVISKLMKLHKESIMYAIKLYKQQTERIKNPTSYMLTILYNAPEQFNLDIQNQVSHDMALWNDRK